MLGKDPKASPPGTLLLEQLSVNEPADGTHPGNRNSQGGNSLHLQQ